MKRHGFAVGLALTVLAVLELSGPAAIGERVPFKGRLEGIVTINPVDPPIMFVLVEGSGKANHFGEITVRIPHVVNRSNSTAAGF
jgi:hypothetical protein